MPALGVSDRPLRVVDFGSGKSYLTFALHHLLTDVHGLAVDVQGNVYGAVVRRQMLKRHVKK